MRIVSLVKAASKRRGIHPRRWLTGLVSYSRYLGYIKPQLVPASEEEFRIRRQLLASAWQPRKLVAPIGKRILALCPHPDDESIGAGGLLLAHRELAEIHLVCLCDETAVHRALHPARCRSVALVLGWPRRPSARECTLCAGLR
jgi:hypothetical protein